MDPLNASIGSRRYGVRDVRHGPASAEVSGDKRRCLSAHSATVSSSGGLKFWTAGAMAALSCLAAFLVVGFICERVAPAFAIPYPPLYTSGVVLVARELVQDFVTLGPDNGRGFGCGLCLHNVHSKAAGRAMIMLRVV